MKLLALSDLHLRGIRTVVRGQDNSCWWKSSPVVSGALKTCSGIYGPIRHANMFPGTDLPDFIDMYPGIAQRINDQNPDLVVVNGDVFDLSPNRDVELYHDAYDAVRDFVGHINAPVVFLLGNSDTTGTTGSFQVPDAIKLFDSLSSEGWENIRSGVLRGQTLVASSADRNSSEYIARTSDGLFIIRKGNGNFALRTEECLLVGLNSIGPKGKGYFSHDENEKFLREVLDGNQDLPVVLFVHRPPFKVFTGVETAVFQKLFNVGSPSGESLLSILKDFAERTGLPVSVVSGHLHKEVDRFDDGVKEVCLLPMLTDEGLLKREKHIGSILSLKDIFQVTDVNI